VVRYASWWTRLRKRVKRAASKALSDPAGAIPLPPCAVQQPQRLLVHGVELVDPYSWMHNVQHPQTQQYLREEQRYTAQVMRPAVSLQKLFYRELKQLVPTEDRSVPERIGQWEYYMRFPPGSNLPLFCRRRCRDSDRSEQTAPSDEEVILDQNNLVGPGEFCHVEVLKVSRDHRWLAFTLDRSGNERFTLYFKDLRSGQLLPTSIPDVANVEWVQSNEATQLEDDSLSTDICANNEQFTTAHFSENASVRYWVYYTVVDALRRPWRVCRYELGTDLRGAEVVWEERDPQFFVDIVRTKDRTCLTLNSNSKQTSEVWLLEVQRDPCGTPILVWPRVPGTECYVEHRADAYWLITNHAGAINYKIMSVSADALRHSSAAAVSTAWREVVPHRSSVKIVDLDLFRDWLVLFERDNGIPNIRVIDLKRLDVAAAASSSVVNALHPSVSHSVQLPDSLCHVEPGINLDFTSQIVRFTYSTPCVPDQTYDYDMPSRTLRLRDSRSVPGYEPSQYVCYRVSVPSSTSGTQIPMTIWHRRGIARPGPVLLHVYGAYGHTLDIRFREDLLPLVARHWTIAFAHVRGGGELGRQWYDAGRALNKLNSFLDFLDCTRWLHRNGYTTSQLLAATAASAGGLVLGYAANNEPWWYAALLCKVPFVDVWSAMRDESLPLTVHEYDEWGNPNDPTVFHYIRSYDPYQNVKPQMYPHMLITTSTNDLRVPCWQPLKWVAKLRALNTANDRFIVLRVLTDGGHFGEGGRYGRLQELAFEYAFLFMTMKLPFTDFRSEGQISSKK
jgi:oligopeptidase B